ncbi:hypothetical protein AB4Z52_33505 [Rhizobium sp. 2YAF20]|uniref:hypothetical protein n=1 Tax=Rhizobium sp. 2YAF20 TaxID=3233027 RepID=UPI003F9C2219
MSGLGDSPQEVLIVSALAVMIVALALSAILRWRGSVAPTDLLPATAFLAAYVLVYNKIPAFPPVGAVNKVFYLALLGTLLGAAVELLRWHVISRALALIQPVVAAVYIGQPRLGVAIWEVVLAALAGLAVALLLFSTTEADGEADIKRGGLVVVVSLGFAPLALLGASSSTFQLCLLFAAANFGILVVHVITKPAFRFGGASILGAWGGLVAVVDTVVLITRKADLVAALVLGLSVVMPRLVSNMACRALGISGRLARLIVYFGLAILPAAAAVLVAFVNYGSSFPI